MEKRLREELDKLQFEINELCRDQRGIKACDDWRRGIIDDLKDSDWMVSFLSRHSIRDPGVRLDEPALRFTGKMGRLQPC